MSPLEYAAIVGFFALLWLVAYIVDRIDKDPNSKEIKRKFTIFFNIGLMAILSFFAINFWCDLTARLSLILFIFYIGLYTYFLYKQNQKLQDIIWTVFAVALIIIFLIVKDYKRAIFIAAIILVGFIKRKNLI